jgi:hypothetical protein
MGADRQIFLHDYSTLVALLTGKAGIHSDHVMTGSFSLILAAFLQR